MDKIQVNVRVLLRPGLQVVEVPADASLKDLQEAVAPLVQAPIESATWRVRLVHASGAIVSGADADKLADVGIESGATLTAILRTGEAASGGASGSSADPSSAPAHEGFVVFVKTLSDKLSERSFEVHVNKADGSPLPSDPAEMAAALTLQDLKQSIHDAVVVKAGKDVADDDFSVPQQRLIKGSNSLPELDATTLKVAGISDGCQITVLKKLRAGDAEAYAQKQQELKEESARRTCVAAAVEQGLLTAQEAALLPRSQIVKITVENCRGLPKVDTLGKIDAFVRIEAEHHHGEDFFPDVVSLIDGDAAEKDAYRHGDGMWVYGASSTYYFGTKCVVKNYNPDFGETFCFKADAVATFGKNYKDPYPPYFNVSVWDWNAKPKRHERVTDFQVKGDTESPIKPALVRVPGTDSPATGAAQEFTMPLNTASASITLKGKFNVFAGSIGRKDKGEARMTGKIQARFVDVSDVFRQMLFRCGNDDSKIVFDSIRAHGHEPDMPEEKALTRQGWFAANTEIVKEWVACPLADLAGDGEKVPANLFLKVTFARDSTVVDVTLIETEGDAADFELKAGAGDLVAKRAECKKDMMPPTKITGESRYRQSNRPLEVAGWLPSSGVFKGVPGKDEPNPRADAGAKHPLHTATAKAKLDSLDAFDTDFTAIEAVINGKAYSLADLGLKLPY